MLNRIFLIGSEVQGLQMDVALDENNQFSCFQSVNLLMFGEVQPIIQLREALHKHLKDWVIAELNMEEQYRSLEREFEKRLGEKVVINNRVTFENVALEYARRTEDDNFMQDMNN